MSQSRRVSRKVTLGCPSGRNRVGDLLPAIQCDRLGEGRKWESVEDLFEQASDQ